MSTELEALESGLGLYRTLITEDASLDEEFQASRAEFFRREKEPEEAAQRALADRRHLEWFLIERPSLALRRPPIEALEERWQKRAGPAERALAPAYKGSHASVFEVTGVTRGEGVWLADLAGQGEYPVREPRASALIEQGDLVVGRVFPVDGAVYRLSRAAALYRNPALLAAVRVDLEQAREGRRGVLRISQGELEAMFWTPRSDPVADPVGEARALLDDAGLEREEAEQVLERLRVEPFEPASMVFGAGDALGPILDRLAFESAVDLDRARKVLIAAWATLSGASERAAGDASTDSDAAAGVGAPLERRHTRDVRAAMEAFDQGRAAGLDLEALFDSLERDLELEELAEAGASGDAAEEEEDLAPDFPGVVGAMVDEFLWETAREQGTAGTGELEPLRSFATFASKIGVFENLGTRDLLLYTTYWLPEFGELDHADAARATLVALRSFCRWAEEQHDVALWSGFRRTLGSLTDSLPRIAEANRRRTRSDPSAGEVFTVLAIEDEHLRLRDPKGEEVERRVDPLLAEWLRVGDRLRARRLDGEDGEGLAVYCCYPPQIAELEPS